MRLVQNSLAILMIIWSLLFWSCDAITTNSNGDLELYSCEGCHTSETTLNNIVDQLNLDPPSDGQIIPGQSRATSILSLTQKVWIRLDSDLGINSFMDIDEQHSQISCAGCHGGYSSLDAADDTSAYHAAHAGLIRDPSEVGEVGCAGGMCHGDIVRRNATSMHSNLNGQKAHVALRNGYESFDECPADIKDAFSEDCSSCHSTCGQCHISRPTSAGGGFLEQQVGSSHKFIRTPDEANVCTSCHSSRIGDDWNGSLTGNQPDAHNQHGYTCLDCHSEDLHGDGSSDAEYSSRYQVSGLPQCVDCHQDDRDDNAFHLKHWPNSNASDGPDLACSVCHSQQYNNCNTCHAGEWMNEYKSDNTGDYRVYSSFKVGRNPYYGETAHPNNNAAWVTVRHVPVAPETYASWGIDILPNYNAMETWKYTSPHNIQRWTSRTLVDAAWAESDSQPYTPDNCANRCHMYGFYNNLFLSDEDLSEDITGEDLSDEIAANARVSVGPKWDSCQGVCHDVVPSN
jgi:hypothetical protein